MLGRLVLQKNRRRRTELTELYGVPVIQSEVRLREHGEERAVLRACAGLRRYGVSALLLPEEIPSSAVPAGVGLRTVSPLPLLRAMSGRLGLYLMEREGQDAAEAKLALRAERVDRELIRTAALLCPRVRNLIIDVPEGGSALSDWLYREFGVPTLPAEERGEAALCFAPVPAAEKQALRLYGEKPDLAGLTISAPDLPEEDAESLPILSTLWENHKLNPESLKIT